MTDETIKLQMNIVSTWLYCSPPHDRVMHRQVGKKSDSKSYQNIYWRCVFCLFESSARLNKNVQNILFVNTYPPKSLDGIQTQDLINSFNIRIVQFENLTRPPLNYYGSWNTQFIVLDVIEWLSKNTNADDIVLILDSDCFFNRPLDEIFVESVRKHKALLYSIDYPINHKINGHSRTDLLNLSKKYNDNLQIEEFVYSGGEFICCKADELELIHSLSREVFGESLKRHTAGQEKFNEEAQLLSYVYHVIGYKTHTANKFIKRIWTDRTDYSNVDGSELNLLIWHLPVEKIYGFKKIYRSLKKEKNKFRPSIDNFPVVFGIEENISRKCRQMCRSIVRRLYRSIFPK